jgi:hypothetical protein
MKCPICWCEAGRRFDVPRRVVSWVLVGVASQGVPRGGSGRWTCPAYFNAIVKTN